MNVYPSYDELIALQDQIAELHTKMHDYVKQYPKNERDFISVAVKLTDASWALDTAVDRAKFIERK